MSESDRLMALRAALMQTTSTVGWTYIKQMAKNIVTQATQAALDEDNPVLGESRRLKAKALQAGFNDFFTVIETTKSFGTESQPEWFTTLSEFEEMAHAGTAGT